jgi:hypothetical protein
MSDDAPKDESTDDSEQQSDEQSAEQADQSTEQSQQQTGDSDQPEEQPTAESDHPTEQSDQVAEAQGEQTDQGNGGTTAASDDTVASAGGDASPAGDEESAAQPAKAGSPPPRKRLFRFVIGFDRTALPDSIKGVLPPDVVTGYFLSYFVASETNNEIPHSADDGWERTDATGIMEFPLNTVEKSRFLIGINVIPNSKVDPNAPTSVPLRRTESIRTDDFALIKATDAPALVKKFPDGVFVLEIKLVAFYIPIVVAGSTTFQAELAQAKIRPEDAAYDAATSATDPSGKVIGTKHDVVYWSADLRLSGKKYVP